MSFRSFFLFSITPFLLSLLPSFLLSFSFLHSFFLSIRLSVVFVSSWNRDPRDRCRPTLSPYFCIAGDVSASCLARESVMARMIRERERENGLPKRCWRGERLLVCWWLRRRRRRWSDATQAATAACMMYRAAAKAIHQTRGYLGGSRLFQFLGGRRRNYLPKRTSPVTLR